MHGLHDLKGLRVESLDRLRAGCDWVQAAAPELGEHLAADAMHHYRREPGVVPQHVDRELRRSGVIALQGRRRGQAQPVRRRDQFAPRLGPRPRRAIRQDEPARNHQCQAARAEDQPPQLGPDGPIPAGRQRLHAAPSARPTSGFGCWFEIRLMQALTSLVTLGRRTTPSVPTSPGNRGTMPARS